MQPQEPADYDKPVAYDNEGHPLYAHPSNEAGQQPTPKNPKTIETGEISQRTQRLHAESVSRFPDVTLSEEEFIVSEVQRHFIGVVIPIAIAILLGLLIIFVLSIYPKLVPSGNPPFSSLLLPAALLLALIALGTYIVVWVFQKNKLFVTNESINQQIQFNLFAHNEQTVDLSEVKDISYAQSGIFQIFFGYGTIILTTEGDGRTYIYTYVSEPKKVVTKLNSVLEDFKNHRPVSEPSMFDSPTI
jgi:uncharacterized membrane protein YdbT with pleckstrin-like domain